MLAEDSRKRDGPKSRYRPVVHATWMAGVRAALTQRGKRTQSKTGWRSPKQKAEFLLAGQSGERFGGTV